jgi:hypothetical protein
MAQLQVSIYSPLICQVAMVDLHSALAGLRIAFLRLHCRHRGHADGKVPLSMQTRNPYASGRPAMPGAPPARGQAT